MGRFYHSSSANSKANFELADKDWLQQLPPKCDRCRQTAHGKRAYQTAPRGRMQNVRVNGGCPIPPRSRSTRPERERPTGKAPVDTTHGGQTAQDTRDLPSLPSERPLRQPRKKQLGSAHTTALYDVCGRSVALDVVIHSEAQPVSEA